jgi:hypothetical protein
VGWDRAVNHEPGDADLPEVDTTDERIARSPILFWFRLRTVPIGGAPGEIRSQWVGIPLPVRRPRPVEGPQAHVGRDVVDRSIVRPIADGVVVEPSDAVAALRFFGRDEAASWWQQHLARRPMLTGLVFRRHEGEFLPPRLALMLHPELADFEVG